MLFQKLLSAVPSSNDYAEIQYVGGRSVSFAGTSANQNISLTVLTGGLASSPSANDLVIVFFATGSLSNRDLVIAGYTEISELYVNGGTDTNLVVAYKYLSAADTTVSITGGTLNSADGGSVGIQVWRNVDPNNLFDAVAQSEVYVVSGLANPPAITPITPGAVIVAVGAAAGGSAILSQSFLSSDLSGFSTSVSNDTYNALIGHGYYKGASGTFNPATFALSGADNIAFSNAAVTLALTPKYIGPTPSIINTQTTQNTSSTTSLVISKPSGTIEGHLMVAVCGGGFTGSNTYTFPTGWTKVADLGADGGTAIAYKVATASEPTAYTITATNNNTHAGAILTIANAAFDTIGTFAVQSSPINAPSINVSESNSLLLAVFLSKGNGGTWTLPINMTSVVLNNDSNPPSYLIAQQLIGSGASGVRSSTLSGISSSGTSGILLSLSYV